MLVEGSKMTLLGQNGAKLFVRLVVCVCSDYWLYLMFTFILH